MYLGGFLFYKARKTTFVADLTKNLLHIRLTTIFFYNIVP
jgi:hypothetical protein